MNRLIVQNAKRVKHIFDNDREDYLFNPGYHLHFESKGKDFYAMLTKERDALVIFNASGREVASHIFKEKIYSRYDSDYRYGRYDSDDRFEGYHCRNIKLSPKGDIVCMLRDNAVKPFRFAKTKFVFFNIRELLEKMEMRREMKFEGIMNELPKKMKIRREMKFKGIMPDFFTFDDNGDIIFSSVNYKEPCYDNDYTEGIFLYNVFKINEKAKTKELLWDGRGFKEDIYESILIKNKRCFLASDSTYNNGEFGKKWVLIDQNGEKLDLNYEGCDCLNDLVILSQQQQGLFFVQNFCRHYEHENKERKNTKVDIVDFNGKGIINTIDLSLILDVNYRYVISAGEDKIACFYAEKNDYKTLKVYTLNTRVQATQKIEETQIHESKIYKIEEIFETVEDFLSKLNFSEEQIEFLDDFRFSSKEKRKNGNPNEIAMGIHSNDSQTRRLLDDGNKEEGNKKEKKKKKKFTYEK